MSATRGLALIKPSDIDSVAFDGVVPAENRMSLVNPAHIYDAVHSPAVDLQSRLLVELGPNADAIEVGKYPPALTIISTIAFCSAFWYGVFKLFF